MGWWMLRLLTTTPARMTPASVAAVRMSVRVAPRTRWVQVFRWVRAVVVIVFCPSRRLRSAVGVGRRVYLVAGGFTLDGSPQIRPGQTAGTARRPQTPAQVSYGAVEGGRDLRAANGVQP